ncbi:sugar transferase [Alteromonas sp. 009811495]|uniref:sugar transferase n=1 Tax=Alteromonas sp. 009811495 TaxID=3002962 RepID=UPI00237E9B24|nr:sugar transferase [Alteromonas sp. 009811495]WDT86982.1 sugar transferase [Alteromonas sp. 009811495]
MKRIFDIIMSFVAIIIFIIPALIISCLIIYFFKHPVLFTQSRIGENKKPFKILKFQTLVENKPTKLGQILRKSGLDELPQFVNVLKGDMSVIGPRALTIEDIARLKWDREFYDFRWNVKPGISGLAQIYGGQHKKTSIFWDKQYIKSYGLSLDLKIILVSFTMNIFGKTKVRRMIFANGALK